MVSDCGLNRGSSQQPPGSSFPDAGAIAMTSVVEITRLFAEARDNCTKVAGTSNGEHVVAFKEDLLNVCLQIAFKGADARNPSGAILEDARYRVAVATNVPYNRQVAARANYDPNRQSDDPVRHAKE